MATRRFLRTALLGLLGFSVFCLVVLELCLKDSYLINLRKHFSPNLTKFEYVREVSAPSIRDPFLPTTEGSKASADKPTTSGTVAPKSSDVRHNSSAGSTSSTKLNGTATGLRVKSSKIQGNSSTKVVLTSPSTTSPRTTVTAKPPTSVDFCKVAKKTSEPNGTFSFKAQVLENGIRPINCTSCFNSVFPTLIENCSVCNTGEGGKSKSVDLAIVILTTHGAVENRQAIRQTWASISRNNTANVRHVFLLGRSKKEKDMQLAQEEQKVYGDIIMYDFMDSYSNLTLKTLSVLHWASRLCGHARFVLKADDDMWVNIPSLLDTLRDKEKDLQTAIGGACMMSAGPIRNPNSKWYASEKFYPQKSYPGFCSGTSYVTSMNVVRHVEAISVHVPFFHLEDVYMSLCIKRLGPPFHLQGLGGFLHGGGHACVLKRKGTISVHQVNPRRLREIWNTKCH